MQFLGITEEEKQTLQNDYESHFTKRVNLLIEHGIGDLDFETIEKFMKMPLLQFSFAIKSIRDRLIHEQMLKPGLELVDKFELLSSKNNLGNVTLKTDQIEQNLMKTAIAKEAFQGILLLNAIPNEGSEGHAMFLQIDNVNNTYILYDNNRGYYQWNDLKQALHGLKLRLKDNNYGTCEIKIMGLKEEI